MLWFKNDLRESENQERQTKKQKENVERNSMTMGCLGITLTSLKRITKVKKTNTDEFPSCFAYEVVNSVRDNFWP
jgi:hypothetical protein